MSKESIIRHDGSILVAWKAKDVTWQTVLQAARAANSEQGGWNNKEFWEELGLNQLTELANGKVAGREFLKQWTLQSLDKDALPLPRRSKFRIDLREKAKGDGRRGSGEPVAAKFGIVREPADEEHRLNWWLYMAQRSEKKKLTYELPLCAESDGLLRADLVHFVPENDGLVEIIELKKGQTEGRDSPLMALVEAICYGLQLLRCWSALQPELNQHLKVEPFEPKHLLLILAAPHFGKDCSGNGTQLTAPQVDKLRAIVRKVHEAVKEKESMPHPELTLSFGNVIEGEWTLEEIFPEQERAVPPGSLLNPKSH